MKLEICQWRRPFKQSFFSVQERYPAELSPVFVAGWDFASAIDSLRPLLAVAWQHAEVREQRAALPQLLAQLRAQDALSRAAHS